MTGFYTGVLALVSANYYYRVILRSVSDWHEQRDKLQKFIGYRDDPRLVGSSLHRLATVAFAPASLLLSWLLVGEDLPTLRRVPTNSWRFLELLISNGAEIAVFALFISFGLAVFYYRVITYVAIGSSND